MKTKIYKISGMYCPSCAMLIESELDDMGFNTKVSFAKQTLEVESVDKASFEKLIQAISALGYEIE